MKQLLTFILLGFLLIYVYGIQTYDMCATFQLATDVSALRLVTPGYLDNQMYPNSSECQCTLEERYVSDQDLSLNITVEELDLEICNDANPYDTITIEAVYRFEIYMKNFVICGDQLPISDLRSLASSTGRYGSENTIYSMGILGVNFKSDAAVEQRGAQLLVESAGGIRIQCHGVSGPLVPQITPTAPPLTTRVASRTTVSPGQQNTPDERKKQSITVGAVVGTLIVLFAIGLGVLVFLLIRKHQTNDPARSGGAHSKSRRPSDGRPIYRDPTEGQPHLPIPTSVRMQSEDQYLYMPGGSPTTPVYANPQPIIYTNQDMMANPGTEEQYQDGYIIPGNANISTEEEVPLVTLPTKPNKAPIPQPKSSRSAASSSDHQINDKSPPSLHSSTDSFPGPKRQPNSESGAEDGLVYEPALVKPSDMKKKGKGSPAKSNVRFGERPVALKPKPPIKAKPKMSANPPAPPKKSLSVTGENGDTYQVVGVETTADS